MTMYGLAFLPNMYALQFAFTGPATGFVVLVIFNVLTGDEHIIAILLELVAHVESDQGTSCHQPMPILTLQSFEND